MTILLTGFEPFGQWTVNASGEAVRSMEGRDGLTTAVLPVDHAAAMDAIRALIATHHPRGVLATGLSGKLAPRLELCARRPAIVADGPERLHGVWPWAAAQAAAQAAGAPTPLSTDAGAYVCETTYWAALAARRVGEPIPVAFLHVPPLSEAWPLARVRGIIEAVLSVMAPSA